MQLELARVQRRESSRATKAHGELRLVVEWYFRNCFGQTEGPEALPFYCDPRCPELFAQVDSTGAVRLLFEVKQVGRDALRGCEDCVTRLCPFAHLRSTDRTLNP